MKNYTVPTENGYYIFKLNNLLESNNISKNKLMKDTNTDFKVLQRLYLGDIVRLDTNVLARLCDYFNCNINDIVEYVPNKELPKTS